MIQCDIFDCEFPLDIRQTIVLSQLCADMNGLHVLEIYMALEKKRHGDLVVSIPQPDRQAELGTKYMQIATNQPLQRSPCTGATIQRGCVIGQVVDK